MCSSFFYPLFDNKQLNVITYYKGKSPELTRGFIRNNCYYFSVRPTGFEPVTLWTGTIRSNPTELRAHIYKYYPNFSAASIVFSTSIAIVIGPTPPGTGVIAETLSITEFQSTSPII